MGGIYISTFKSALARGLWDATHPPGWPSSSASLQIFQLMHLS